MIEVISSRQLRALMFVAETERAANEIYEHFGDDWASVNVRAGLTLLESMGLVTQRGVHRRFWSVTNKGRSELARLASEITAALS